MRFLFTALLLASTLFAEETPEDFKVAFLADQGIGPESRDVMRLLKREKVKALVHAGDFDYEKNPAAWDAMLTKYLGADFPVFACPGNHDTERWKGPGGYQELLEARLRRAGVEWEGELGEKSAIEFGGILILLVSPAVLGEGHAEYLRKRLDAAAERWRVAVWHRNQAAMQVGKQRDAVGWGVYEEARKGGAFVITGHEHLYCRTWLMKSFEEQVVASRKDEFELKRGRSFAAVVGLGGKSVRPQKFVGDWWASVYSDTQRARPGALFAVFNADGEAERARFYFKDWRGRVVDEFTVTSRLKKRAPRGCRAEDEPGDTAACLAGGARFLGSGPAAR